MTKFLALSLFFSLILNFELNAITKVGAWNDYLPYKIATQVVTAGNKIYCTTANSLFYYDVNDKSINKISKIQGLNDVGISSIAYDPQNDALIIAYINSNIDIIKKSTITNKPDIKNKITITDRRINSIYIYNGMAYLACGYGITILNLNSLQFGDTYYPSSDGTVNKVNDVCTDGNFIYAATAKGIFRASYNNDLLVDYSNWNLMKNFTGYNYECNGIKCIPGRVFAIYKNSNYAVSDSLMTFDGTNWQQISISNYSNKIRSLNASGDKAIVVAGYNVIGIDKNLNISQIGGGSSPVYADIDNNENTWVADQIRTLLEFDSKGNGLNNISPDSPVFPDAYKVDCNNGTIWTAAGSPTSDWVDWEYNNHGVESFSNNSWTCFDADNTALLNPIRDIVNVKIDPNNPNRVFMASWGWGLIEYNNGNFTTIDKTNSTIQPWVSDNILHRYQIAGISFDASGNLWCASAQSKNALNVLTSSGKWHSFNITNNPNINGLLASSIGQLWMTLTSSTTVIVYNYNSTIDNNADDIQTSFNFGSVASLITSNNIYCMAEDKTGNIWFGTDAGPIRLSDPTNVATNGASSAAKILVPIVKGKSAATYLLETERINAIAVDGGDRKWFGTQNSGAYLVSSDGTNVISHFSATNSPLFSNTILDIAIDKISGEVYFATDNGLIGYRGNAIEGLDDFGKVYVYPNPVRPEYTGDIYITGLITDANVKITDITGNLVYETKALGGQAVWNGKNLLNKRVHTGIYLVFCSNQDGTKTHVTKLLFVH